MITEQELRAGFAAATTIIHTSRGALRRLRPHVLERDVDAVVHNMTEGNRALEHLLKNEGERQRIFGTEHREILTGRRRAAAVALYPLRAVERHVDQWRHFGARNKRHIPLSLPDALNNVDANGMIMLALLREHRQGPRAKINVEGL